MDNLTASYQEVENFFAELLDSKTLKAKKYLVYNIYKEAVEKNKIVSDIEQYFSKFTTANKQCSVQIPDENENVAIITWALANGNTEYSYCFFNDAHQVVHTTDKTWDSFDDAYVASICRKRHCEEDTVNWIKKLMKN